MQNCGKLILHASFFFIVASKLFGLRASVLVSDLTAISVCRVALLIILLILRSFPSRFSPFDFLDSNPSDLLKYSSSQFLNLINQNASEGNFLILLELLARVDELWCSLG